MAFTYFVQFESPNRPQVRLGEHGRRWLIDFLRRTPGLTKGRLYMPAEVDTPFSADKPLPVLALQLYFTSLPSLEAAIAERGHLQAIAARDALPELAGASVTHQAMLARSFPVPQPQPSSAATQCSLLVHYPGPAQDLNAWLRHYLDRHTPLLAKFPGIRDVEVCTRVDWCDALPWRRVDHMQRNRVAFDSGDALAAALASPVLDELRADSRSLPPFAGGSRHHPMHMITFAGTAP
ncbi:MAG: EthD family reductase [Gemmatimonadota bacterium]